MSINAKIGEKSLKIVLEDSKTAKEFKSLLPITLKMKDLNNNEKHITLPKSLTTNSKNPLMINKGDLMLYGDDTLVLFYETFSTSYSYTKIGTIEDTTNLKELLGSKTITITFE